MTVLELAQQAAYIMGWVISSNYESSDSAKIQRPDDKLTFWIHVPYKKKNLEIQLDLGHLDISRDTRTRTESLYAATCTHDAHAIVRTIEQRLIPTAMPVYTEFLNDIDKATRTKARQLRELQDLASVFGTTVRMGETYRTDVDPHFGITMFDLTLDFEAGNRGFALKGYCNSIPVDLMMRLVPVINAWHAEKSEAAK